MANAKYKPLDIVKHNDNSVGIITEGINNCSISWLENASFHKSAWWSVEEMDGQLKVIGNMANFLTRGLAHPFGDGADAADEVYPFGEAQQ